jgi:two-component system, cell cycle response regulator
MRIALVEPSRTVRRIVTGMIEAWDHDVRPFTDSGEALEQLQLDKKIRALITSAELPSSSGARLVADARRLAGTQRPLYILLMSSSDERAKMVQALDNGADDFISKPPAAEELRARLRAADRITMMQAELVALATTDSLTGLMTRRAFVATAEEMVERAKVGHPLSVLVCDLDRFKAINDTHGHDIGDVVLQRVSAAVKAMGAPAGRLGGEEVAMLLEAELDEAVALAERFRQSVGMLAIQAGETTIGISCSIGVAQWKPAETIDVLLRRADLALYEAKHAGRNRVMVADAFSLSAVQESWLKGEQLMSGN